ncbi:MAG TPA: GNAT family N-acetyltransferase [Anaerolineales bacterium]|nr:GNAT family N-acetyltransferase [Anaerolineales bacterium]
MTITIRTLSDADLEEADEILKAAFQSPASRLEDLRFYRQLEPEGWFVACQGDELIGMVGEVCYGAFAHVGLMAVHPRAQRQGAGMALMQFLLDRLDRQVPVITLDASAMGRPLYEKLGFVGFEETYIYQFPRPASRAPDTSRVQSITEGELDELAAWDAGMFGANRRKVFEALLRLIPERAFLHRDAHGRLDGYLFAQKNRIGPWVALESGSAGELLQAALALPDEGGPSAAVPAENRAAMELLEWYGFEKVRSNLHMGRHIQSIPGRRDKIYAQTSLAAG